MNHTWDPGEQPKLPPIASWRWLLIGLRGLLLFLVLSCGVIVTAVLRLVEAPVFGLHRPVTPYITVAVCRICLGIIGLTVEREGKPLVQRGAIVANHVSWLDVFVLNARKRIYFVSKSEVAGWPGIGLLARITGTVFIARDPKQAKTQLDLFVRRLVAGHKLLFFPEGTSTDGMRVLPFKTTLFQSFFDEKLRSEVQLQPTTLVYQAPATRDARFYGWWGDMGFAPHLLHILSAGRQGRVRIIYHAPVRVSDFADRKALAKHLEEAVRDGMPKDRQGVG